MPRSHFYRRSYRFGRRRARRGGFKRRKTTEWTNFSRQSFHRFPNEVSTRVKGVRTIPASLGAYPSAIRVCLPFTETCQVTTVAGVGAWYQWRGNSLYDPDITGAGSQPYAYDQWSTFYAAWNVTGSSIEVTAANTQSGVTPDQACIKLVVCPISSTMPAITSTVLDTIEEYNYARYRLLSSSAASGMQENTIRHYMSTAQIEGIAPATVLSDHNYQGYTTSNPNAFWRWIVGVNNMNENGSTTYTLHVKIRYYVVFSAPQMGSSS